MAKQVSFPAVFSICFPSSLPPLRVFYKATIQVHELSGCGDFFSALELAQCVDDSAALLAGLHVAYGDDMFRKVGTFFRTSSPFPALFV